MRVNDAYRSQLSAEIRLIGTVLSPSFKIDSLPDTFENIDPDKLFPVLKTHRLYTAFHYLHLPYHQLGNPEWNTFSATLQQLARVNNMQMLHKTSVLVKVVNAFENAGIKLLSLKGPVLSKILHDNFAMKSSIDLDILIDESQWEEAVVVLKKEGFAQAKYDYELNKSQIRYLRKHFHHLGFFHPEEKISLELHWQLNTNKHLLGYRFEEMHENALEINIGNQIIRTLEPCRLAVYIMVHGAHHAWSRLDWLYDFSLVLNKYQHLYKEIAQESRKRGLGTLFAMSVRLSNIVFQTHLPETLKSPSKESSMLKFCIRSINLGMVADYTRPLERINQKLYLMKFKKSLRYKIHVWLALRTNMLDWQTIKLPPRLFFLYYFLRPVLIILNRKKGKQ